MEYSSVVSAIDPPDFKEQLIKKYQSTTDIISDLIYCFKIYNYQAQPVSKIFRTGDIKTDSKKIYDFIKNNIVYNAEPFTNQTTASFSRIIHNKTGDCKHSALIVAAIGYNMGYNVIFRFASYDKDKQLGHVYTILQDPKTKEKIIVDPLQSFDYEKPYTKKKDYLAVNLKPNNMSLKRLSGYESASETPVQISTTHPKKFTKITFTPLLSDDKIGEIEMLEGIGKKHRERKHRGRALFKKIKSNIKKDVSKIKHAHPFKKIALAPVRAAFDVLLAFNFRNLAGRLSQAIQTDPNRVQALATKFGYSFGVFSSNVAKGAKKKSIGEIPGQVGSIAAVTSAAAVAAPMVIAVIPLLKSIIGSHPTDDQSTDESATAIDKIPDSTPGADPTDTSSTKSKYIKPVIITLAGATILYFGGKAVGVFGKK